jgi:hypothetical protein
MLPSRSGTGDFRTRLGYFSRICEMLFGGSPVCLDRPAIVRKSHCKSASATNNLLSSGSVMISSHLLPEGFGIAVGVAVCIYATTIVTSEEGVPGSGARQGAASLPVLLNSFCCITPVATIPKRNIETGCRIYTASSPMVFNGPATPPPWRRWRPLNPAENGAVLRRP